MFKPRLQGKGSTGQVDLLVGPGGCFNLREKNMERFAGGKEPNTFRLRPEYDFWGTYRVMGSQ